MKDGAHNTLRHRIPCTYASETNKENREGIVYLLERVALVRRFLSLVKEMNTHIGTAAHCKKTLKDEKTTNTLEISSGWGPTCRDVVLYEYFWDEILCEYICHVRDNF